MQREQAETRFQQLEEELGRITQQLQEEQQKLDHHQQTQDKEREEYARSDSTTFCLAVYFLNFLKFKSNLIKGY